MMPSFKVIFFPFVLACIIAFSVPSFAMETGFITQAIDSQRQEDIIESRDLKVINHVSDNSQFVCFSVNPQGSIAIGLENGSDRKEIAVYNLEGAFQYGFSFVIYGTYALEWDGDRVILANCRVDSAEMYDRNGLCLEAGEIVLNADNNLYWKELFERTEMRCGGYAVKFDEKSQIMGHYTRLIAVSEDGTEKVIFDAGKFPIIRNTIFVLIFILVGITIAIVSVRHYKKQK